MEIPEVALIKPRMIGDERGYFMETWREDLFKAAGIDATFRQANQSKSRAHTLRGLHYQIQQPQGKLAGVLDGEVFDVAVDMRRSSPSFGRWVGALLSAENGHQLWVPAGFAHGFLVLSEFATFSYLCTDFYAPQYERVVSWDDPEIGIDWPLPPGVEPLLSEKDRCGIAVGEADTYP
jgi:dTDP-4-dehydrorhamnose 3,5-epimerase